MEQISSKRNPFVFIFFLVLLLLAAGYILYSFVLPRYIEKKVLPSLGDHLFTSLSGQVFSIGLNEASLGDIIIGESHNAAGSIDLIHAEYSLSSILDKKIKQLRINGLTLNLDVSEGRIIIPGLNLEKITAAKSKKEVPQDSSATDLPLQFDNFQVSNGFINILYEDYPILVPFSLQITRKKQTDKVTLPTYRMNLQIFPQGEKIEISGVADLANNKGKLTLAADSLDMKPFAFLLGELEEILSFAKVSIKSNAEIKIIPFQVLATEFECELESLNFKNFPVIFATSAGSGNSTNSLQLKIKGNGQQWDVNGHGSMAEPLSASIALDGTFKQGDDGAKGFGTFLISIADKTVTLSPDQTPVAIKGNPDLRGDFSTNITPAGAWQLKIDSSGSNETLGISSGPNSLNAKIPSFNILGKGSADDTQLQVSLAFPNVHATISDAAEVTMPMAEFQAFLNQDKKSDQKKLTNGEFSISLPAVKMKKNTLTGKADIAFTGEMVPQTLQDMKSLQMAGEFIVDNAKAVDKETGITINSMDGRLPWQWSYPERKTTGRIKISGIKWKNNELGSIEAGVKLNSSEYLLDGKFTHSLLNGLVTNISGQANIVDSEYGASLNLQMAPKAFSSLHLGKFNPSMINSYINGELGLDGNFRFDTNGVKGHIAIVLQNGRFEFPEKKYEINNFNLSLLFPALPDLRSAPAQKFLFDKASIDDLIFKEGKIIFQLESTDSFFVEEGVVNWAGGRIFTNSVRISPDRKEFIVTIFCDRLVLSQILSQFGVSNAEGEGTVSGRLPLLVGKKTLSFEDGFLYSSPGQGGSIKVKAFDMLSAGIPKNSPQFAQVDFAAEALKNFQYNWVKLLLNSEGEDLIMQMHMDGKPLQSLPFSYDSQTGLFQRLDGNSPGISQPIRLDVNFRLPLNRFLGYSGRIQDIMDKLQ